MTFTKGSNSEKQKLIVCFNLTITANNMWPIKLLTTAKLDWFDDGCCDVKYLDIWHDAAPSYRPGQPIDDSWHIDQYELPLGHDADGRLFQKATDLLMRYQFYPEDIVSHVSDFSLGERRLRVGDRIVQRIHLFNLFGKPVLDVVAMTEINSVTALPRRSAISYVTVDTHVEQGEWRACVEWHDDGDLTLSLRAISKPVPDEPARNYGFMRARQQVAHQRGMQHFKQAVLS